MLECRNVSVFYGRHRAVENVSLTVSTGEIVVMLGANGAGKSTFLRAIAGQVPFREGGSVVMEGQDISHRPAHEIVESGIALVPEDRGVFNELTVHDNLLLGAYPRRARAREAENLERVHSLFPKLAERRRQLVRTMSGGERQMVAVGRAMMSAPAILMLDEPSLGLSPLIVNEMFTAIRRVHAEGTAVLLVEQNVSMAMRVADRAYVLEEGRMVAEGTPDELMQRDEIRRAYLGI